jgi:4-amino-4-deoxy-L-arabinose transferase-like glycosyltransferase
MIASGDHLSKKSGIGLLIIIITALALRVLFSVAVVGIGAEPRGDEIDYHTIASNIAEGRGFSLGEDRPTARRPPLYPLFLSAWYKLFTPKVELGRLVQLILGTFIVLSVFYLARAVFNEQVALFSASLAAVNPFMIFISGYLLTENLYVLLLLIFLITTRVSGIHTVSVKRTALAGLILGLCVLSRPPAILLWAFVVVFIVDFSFDRFRIKLFRGLILLLAFGLTVLPWAARNHAVFGKWIFFTTHGGVTFYQSNNQAVLYWPQYRGGVAPLYALPEHEKLKSLDEITRDREAWKLGKTFLAEHKNLVFQLVVRKFHRFWRFRSDFGMSGIKSGWWWNKDSPIGRMASRLDLGFIYAVIVIPFFVLGMIVTRSFYKQLLFLYGVIAVHMLVALVFYGSLRGRLPLEPIMAIFAAVGMISVFKRIGLGFRSRQ